MLKNISAGERTVEEKSECIKERNAHIKSGSYSIIDPGIVASDIIIVGEQHKEAAIYLETCVASAKDIVEVIDFERETEDMYDVQCWSGTDFDLSKVLENKESK